MGVCKYLGFIVVVFMARCFELLLGAGFLGEDDDLLAVVCDDGVAAAAL